MNISKSIVTQKGIELNAKLLKEGKPLIVVKAIGGSDYILEPYENIETVQTEVIKFECNQVPIHENDELTIKLYYANDDVTEDKQINYICLFAKDEETEILYAIAPLLNTDEKLYSMPVPQTKKARFELVVDFIIKLSNKVTVNVIVSSNVYLTHVEADNTYAKLQHRHEAIQVDETVGKTTEWVQREQDARLDVLEERANTGITSVVSQDINTEKPARYNVIDHNGIYDTERELYYIN